MLIRLLQLPVIARRLLLSLLLSLLVHMWMFGGLARWLADDALPESTLIRVELLPRSSPESVAKSSMPETPEPVQQAHPPEPKPAISEKPEEPVPVPEPYVPASESMVPSPAVSMPEQQPVAEPQPSEVVPVVVEEPAPKTPTRVVIDYEILRKGSVAGLEHHRFQATEDGSYSLTSLAEAKGLLALALSDLVQKSEGRVTSQGLQPTSYQYQYGKNADKVQNATFDWQNRVLTMEVGSRSQTVELKEGTQDLLSFMYQFMFVPPLQQMQLAVTNGKKLKVYNYGFEGEETLTTKIGPLRTLNIGKSSSDGDEKTEIWLAVDYYYLPVKISKTDKDGTVTERIVTGMQIE